MGARASELRITNQRGTRSRAHLIADHTELAALLGSPSLILPRQHHRREQPQSPLDVAPSGHRPMTSQGARRK